MHKHSARTHRGCTSIGRSSSALLTALARVEVELFFAKVEILLQAAFFQFYESFACSEGRRALTWCTFVRAAVTHPALLFSLTPLLSWLPLCSP